MHDVVIAGGGIGGLTAAALLSSRGLDVCLVERNSWPGGCATTVAHCGHSFDSGSALYTGWAPGDIHDRISTELKLAHPQVARLDPSCAVRLEDPGDITLGGSIGELEQTLRQSFPDCAEHAVGFYRELHETAEALQRLLRRAPKLTFTNTSRLAFSNPRLALKYLRYRRKTLETILRQTSKCFRRFIDLQLQVIHQQGCEDSTFFYAALALNLPLRGVYALNGGASALADALVKAIRQNGGSVLFNATAHRLTTDAGGRANGLMLQNGERIQARRAVISNLTVWDTYGRLVGLDRTPAALRKQIQTVQGFAGYLVYLSLDEKVRSKLPAAHIFFAKNDQEFDATGPGRGSKQPLSGFVLNVAAPGKNIAPEGRCAATLTSFTPVEPWFNYQKDEDALEALDQQELEKCWEALHQSFPEIGDSVEVIETANPRTLYDQTRRRPGVIGPASGSHGVLGTRLPGYTTSVPNLYMVGDTVFPGRGLAAVSESALIVATMIAPKPTGGWRD